MRSGSDRVDPIMNVPAGTRTSFMPMEFSMTMASSWAQHIVDTAKAARNVGNRMYRSLIIVVTQGVSGQPSA
jgi:hypothetical protein